MRLRQLFESHASSVGIIFGRFNPPHQGHKAAWEMASQNDHWFVGTNKSTQGPKDPLPYDVKVKAMLAVWPELKGHIVPETSWLTLASQVYKKFGNVQLNVYTDEDWVTKTIIQYNGKEGPHGLYNFPSIKQHPTPRLSSATALRAAVTAGDREAFTQAAGVPADTDVAGHPYFDIVAHFLGAMAKPEKKAVKKKEKEVAEMDKSQPAHGRDGRVSHSTYGSRDKHDISNGPDVHLGPKNMLTRNQANKKLGNILDKEMGRAHRKDVNEIAGAFPSPSTRAKWAADAAASNSAEAKRQAELKAQQLQKNTAEVDRLQKINHHSLDGQAVTPKNETHDEPTRDKELYNLQADLWDLYKDVTGFRPRPGNVDWTPEQWKDKDFLRSKINHYVKFLDSDLDEEAAGVGIITKQNTTVDVNKNTPKKNLKAFRLA